MKTIRQNRTGIRVDNYVEMLFDPHDDRSCDNEPYLPMNLFDSIYSLDRMQRLVNG